MIDVSIIIPVKNGGQLFKMVLEGIHKQNFDGTYEVICVDSGSTDQSKQNILRNNFKLYEISSSDFGHGKTRNFGASKGTGEYIVFLTHDAIPANENWLSQLIKPLQDDKMVAGSFSRHIAHEDADPFTKWELEEHFKGLRHYPVCDKNNHPDYQTNQGLQQVFHFFSDNASCLRRSVWLEIPLPEVQFAEDQIWAKTIIEKGYRKAFAYDSVVQHSHTFGPWETLRRSFDESRAFKKLFGYILSDSLSSSFRSGLYLLKRDLQNAIKKKWFLTHPASTLSMVLKSFTRPLGHFLGSCENLPEIIESRISRDDWIRKL